MMNQKPEIIMLIAIAATAVMCTLANVISAGETAPCRDIRSIDFKTGNIEIPNRGMVRLENGVGFTSEAGPAGESKDWKIRLVQDDILQPSASTTLRLVRLTASHLTGSGEWDHVFIIECRGGKLLRTFQESYLYGVRIQALGNGELHFVSGEWMKSDPMCCPSQEKYSVYRWDSNLMRYVLAQETIRPRSSDPK